MLSLIAILEQTNGKERLRCIKFKNGKKRKFHNGTRNSRLPEKERDLLRQRFVGRKVELKKLDNLNNETGDE